MQRHIVLNVTVSILLVADCRLVIAYLYSSRIEKTRFLDGSAADTTTRKFSFGPESDSSTINLASDYLQ
jgi:hypothetical protein